MKTYIPIPTYNRLELAKVCIGNMVETTVNKPVKIEIYDDMSNYDAEIEFKPLGVDVTLLKAKAGIHIMRCLQLHEFLTKHQDCEFVYLTDSDAFHDPKWFEIGMELIHKYQRPVSLYNTIFHQEWGIWQNKEISCRQYFAGISLLLHRSMVQGLFPRAAQITSEWDFRVSELLGNEIVVSNQSWLDHYGNTTGLHGGFNWDRDHASNATDWLMQKRFEMIPKLQELKV